MGAKSNMRIIFFNFRIHSIDLVFFLLSIVFSLKKMLIFNTILKQINEQFTQEINPLNHKFFYSLHCIEYLQILYFDSNQNCFINSYALTFRLFFNH